MAESKYTVAELMAAAGDAFKTSRAVVAGALHDVKEPITKQEAEERIAAFKNKVIHAPGEPVPTPKPAVEPTAAVQTVEEEPKTRKTRTKTDTEGAGQ